MSMGKLAAFADTLFADGWPTFFAVGLIIGVFGFELAMNLKNAEGWVSTAHLAVIGPLWLFLSGVTLLGLYRRLASGLHVRKATVQGDS